MAGANVDAATVAGFGEQWARYDQTARSPSDLKQTFDRYFSEFPWADLPEGACGFDAGCGSGRWTAIVAPRVGHLWAVDPSPRALAVARSTLAAHSNIAVLCGAAGSLPMRSSSMDFGYSLGVLHHTPDPAAGLRDCVRCLRPGAPFLLYHYYALDHRPRWFRAVWRASDAVRRRVSRFRPSARHRIATLIAAVVYLPLARSAPLLRRVGVRHTPLSAYEDKPFSVMQTDAFDRFATPVEHRATRKEIVAVMSEAGLENIRVRDGEPFWCAVGTRRRTTP